MSERTITITERDGAYEIQNDGISEFALIGILECVLFDIKTARSAKPIVENESAASAETNTETNENETVQELEESNAELKKERDDELDDKPENTLNEIPQPKVVPPSSSPELRMHIANAVKAIKALGGQVGERNDLSDATDEELKTELEELTEQYKRLKSSKSVKK